MVLTFEPVAKYLRLTNQLTPLCQLFLLVHWGRISRELDCLIATRLSLSRCKFTRGNLVVPHALSPVPHVSHSPLFTTKVRENEVPDEEAGNLICHKMFSEK